MNSIIRTVVLALSLTLPFQSASAADVEAGFSPGDAESLVLRAIGEASKTIRMAAYSFTSKPIAVALVKAHNRGVDVQVVLDRSQKKERYTGATFLTNEGILVRINSNYSIMHNKFLVIDGKTVQTGSFNYTRSAAEKNAENVVLINDDMKTAKQYETEWQRLWSESE